jgi:monoamine oxidase
VVGAGLAGLVAARTLKRAGLSVRLFEAAKRVGGRTHSLLDRFGSGLATEMGGEFVDSRHADMLALAHEFGLTVLDTQESSEDGLSVRYFFQKHLRTESDLLRAFEPLAKRMSTDASRLSPTISAFEHSSFDRAMDQLSIAAYLDKIGARGWVRRLIEVAYLTEYGAELSRQSCLNLLTMLSFDASTAFDVFGESDERYKIKGGVGQIAQALSEQLTPELQLGQALVSIDRDERGPVLGFEHDGAHHTVSADFVVLAIPFTVLRTIPITWDLPPQKRLAIDTLGYGSNEKLVVGLREPVWRNSGSNGQAFSDLDFQTGWDSSRMQGAGASFSFFVGGETGAALASAEHASLAKHYVQEANTLFPGLSDVFTGELEATGWSINPLSRGSYSHYQPGQWTTIAGWEGESCGPLFFAGEHCSRDFQGYMNGAAETGRRAAEHIVDLVKGEVPR